MQISLSKNKLYISFILCFLYFVSLNLKSFAQEQLTSDELFVKARKLAFDDKNYPEAIRLTKEALLKSPDYADIKIFLGRLYTWTNKTDSARLVFKEVLAKKQGYEDAALAYGTLEYWNDQPAAALLIVNDGLKANPKSQDLLLLKAKILNEERDYTQANNTLNELIKINPNLSSARALSEKIKDVAAKNSVGLSYDYIYFDKQFNDPWQLAGVDYGRQTKLGSITTRFNYANRFKTNGAQLEIDAYPHLSDIFYAYASVGFSNNSGVFPKFRSGFSLYANLPSAFEAELGFRMLSFSDQTWIYTASVGKYIKNYWLNLRTYLTPSNNSVSQSVSLNVRYYFGGANDYLSLGIGTGISPDNQQNIALYNNGNAYKLKSNNVSLGFKKSLNATNILFLKGAYENQEYLPRTKGNQLSISLGYSKRF